MSADVYSQVLLHSAILQGMDFQKPGSDLLP